MVAFRNDTLGTRAVVVGGVYRFVDPGETIEVDNPENVSDGLVRVSAAGKLVTELPPVPPALKAKVAAQAKSAPKKRVTRRRTKAPK